MGTKIPIIDHQKLNQNLNSLKEASSEWGCFRLVNHGIQPELMAEMKGVVMELLDLTAEIKSRNVDVIPGGGYMGPTQKNPLYEALGLFNIGDSNAVSQFCSQLQVSSTQRAIIEKYAKAIHTLALDLATRLANSLGLSTYDFRDWPSQFRINKYTFTEEALGTTGVQIHTDSGFLTILQDDETIGGLEVMDLNGEFVPVDPMSGSLLVNLGDISVPWSNGRLRNVQHRVQCKDVGLRYSIATFFSPPADRPVEPPPEFVSADHPPVYSVFTYEEYRKLRATTKLHAGEALELVLDKK